jgi:putative MATE family efflux protein
MPSGKRFRPLSRKRAPRPNFGTDGGSDQAARDAADADREPVIVSFLIYCAAQAVYGTNRMQRSATHHAKRFTEGSIVRSLVALALPIVFANVLQTAYQLVDTFWVGRLGGEAVAAVSVSFPLIFLMIALGGGLAVAGSVLVAQYAGARNAAKVNHVTAQTLLMVLVVSLLLSALGYALSPHALALMGVEPSTLRDATRYLQVSFVGMVFTFGYFVYQSVLRGIGEVRAPVYIVFGTVLLNLLLDPLFIFGWGPIPGAGVAGAAYATISTQGVAMAVGLVTLFGGHFGIHLKLQDFSPDWPLMQQVVRLGLPASLEQSTRALGLTVMTFLVATFGTSTIASYGIGTRILSFVIIPAMGLSMATSMLVAQNIGAGNKDRASTIAWLSAGIGFGVLELVGLLCFVFATPLIRFFVPNAADVIAGGTQFLRLMALSFGFIGLQQTLGGAFRGSGNTVNTMILAMVSLWVLQFPTAYILSKHTPLGAIGLWWAFPIANVTIACVATLWFLQGGWRKTNLIGEPEHELVEEITEEAIVQEGINS